MAEQFAAIGELVSQLDAGGDNGGTRQPTARTPAAPQKKKGR